MMHLIRPLAACSFSTPLQCVLFPAAARSMSSASSAVVDQMLSYVWQDLKGQGQPAIDVLRSGLSMQPDPSKGFDSARLNMAMGEVFAAEHNWGEAASCSQAAAAAAAGDSSTSAAGLAALARFQATRTLLVAGRDAEAAASSNSSNKADAADMAQQLLVQHATTQLQPAAAAAALQQLRTALAAQQQNSSSGGVPGVLLALSHKVSGDAALAQGQLDEAAASYDAARTALGGSSSSSGGGGDGKAAVAQFSADAAAGLSSRLQLEVAADIALGAAQVPMARKQWEASEEALSAALAAAEAAAGAEQSPLLVPVLLLLAGVYCRSARLMYAEGMLREAAKMLGASEPAKLVEKASSSRQAVHPSLKAALAWRYVQLLSVQLPNRAAEANAWTAAAQQLWAQAGGGFAGSVSDIVSNGGVCSIAEVLGDDVALTGKGEHGHGRGAVVSLFARRLLPVLPASC